MLEGVLKFDSYRAHDSKSLRPPRRREQSTSVEYFTLDWMGADMSLVHGLGVQREAFRCRDEQELPACTSINCDLPSSLTQISSDDDCACHHIVHTSRFTPRG
jgi:hypothetical protein